MGIDSSCLSKEGLLLTKTSFENGRYKDDHVLNIVLETRIREGFETLARNCKWLKQGSKI